MGIRILLASATFMASTCLASNIIVDGNFSDWNDITPVFTDPAGDNTRAGPDIREVQITNDGYSLFLRIEFSQPVNLRTADLQLFIDADNNIATGRSQNGRGMDFVWDFDRNRGTGSLLSRSDIGRGNLIQRIAPEGASTEHEFAIGIEALPAILNGEPLYLSIVEENSRDQLPDAGSAFAYSATGPLSVQDIPMDVSKMQGTVRLVSWNVLRDAPFESTNNLNAFRRVISALQPDIIMLQEVYDTSSATVLDFFKTYFQTAPGSEWVISRNYDCITVSRFPISNGWPVDGNLISRIETGDTLGTELLIVNAHLPCCENESGRIEESDNLINILGSRLSDSRSFPQAIIIGGDLNSGGVAPELIMLSTAFGNFKMASPRHLYSNDQYTWGSRGSSFGSSKLDFLIFDDSLLFRQKAFVLDTDVVPSSVLTQLKLQANDTFVSDHLPLIFDFRSNSLPEYFDATPMEADGTATSSWFGSINAKEYPWIRQERLGQIRVAKSGNDYWYLTESGLWFYTDPSSFPWVFFPKFD